MKIVLFVEGETERNVLPEFLARWLNSRLPVRVGIKPVKFEGWPDLIKGMKKKAELYLTEPDVLAVVSILDLYGPTIYPRTCADAASRWNWGKAELEKRIGHPRFRHFFAVHETEAWLLADSTIFPAEIREEIHRIGQPETVNFDSPPARFLDRVYERRLRRAYRKVVDGVNLFKGLDPDKAYEKCPRLRELLDELLRIAEANSDSSPAR